MDEKIQGLLAGKAAGLTLISSLIIFFHTGPIYLSGYVIFKPLVGFFLLAPGFVEGD